MKIGNREFQTKGHTYVMGILNVTPDSFSDGGKWNDRDRALKHVEEMIAEGMDIVDIGGESTRPWGYTLLSDEEEIARVVPMIESVKANFDIPISQPAAIGTESFGGVAAAHRTDCSYCYLFCPFVCHIHETGSQITVMISMFY